MTAQTPAPSPPTGANTIVIACKLPSGLKLELGRPEEEGYQTYTLNGPHSKKGLVDGTGYALTTIPAAFWNAWLDQPGRDPQNKIIAKAPNRALPALKNGLIYAHGDRDSVEAFAMEHSSARTGLEPLDPNKMPEHLKKFDAKD